MYYNLGLTGRSREYWRRDSIYIWGERMKVIGELFAGIKDISDTFACSSSRSSPQGPFDFNPTPRPRLPLTKTCARTTHLDNGLPLGLPIPQGTGVKIGKNP